MPVTRISCFVGRMAQLSRNQKIVLFVLSDVIFLIFNIYLAAAARSGRLWPDHLFADALWLVPAGCLITIPVFLRLGLYRHVLRHGGMSILAIAMKAVSLAAVLLLLVAINLASPRFPFSLLAIWWGGMLLTTGAGRLLVHWLLRAAMRRQRTVEKVAIFGAGHAGASLYNSLRSNPEYRVIAFFDDNPALHGRQIDGITIHSPTKLEGLIQDKGVRRLLLAMPSAPMSRRQQLIVRLARMPVQVQTVPPLKEILGGTSIAQTRDVSVEELLWRDPVRPLPDLLDRDVRGKSVLVTGGGGSIGSELARQIVTLGPKRLVVLDHGEFALYQIETELSEKNGAVAGGVDMRFVLGSVCDAASMLDAMRRYEIDTVYHAAAYKHVPIVEANPLRGIVNNAIGTLRTAQAAMNAGVEKFVLISTDKAVRPTNVMGATKRLAETILQALSAQGSATVFTMVRFGNVLNSAGSVVPRFRRQIAEGGPVTVTHRNIVRYFMTIPEAVGLVLQAGALARGGEVFVLDMGEPVHIYELARRLIHLSGFTVRDEHNPDGEIPIVITGLRPGEKLFEELLIGTDVDQTPHPRILKAQESFLSWSELEPLLREFERAASREDVPEALALLRAAVPEYLAKLGVQSFAPRSDVGRDGRAAPTIRLANQA